MTRSSIEIGRSAIPAARPGITIRQENRGHVKTDREIRKLVGKLVGERSELQLKIKRLELQAQRVSAELIALLTDHPKASNAMRLIDYPVRRYPLAATVEILAAHFGPKVASMLGVADAGAVTKLLATLPDDRAGKLRAALDAAGEVTTEKRLRAVRRSGSWA